MTDIWTCFKADHGSWQSGACPKCHREAKQRIEELEQRYGDDEIATAVNVALQQRIEELEETLTKSIGNCEHWIQKYNRLETALNYIGDPQNGMVDLAAYARKALE